MFLNKFLFGLGLIGTVLTIAPQAQAATLTGFTFGTQVTGTNPKKDIRLDSVTIGTTIGTTRINQFELVKAANVVTNTMIFTAIGEYGPASSEHGDDTTIDSTLPEGPKKEILLANDPASNAAVVASLGNLNMNSIIDTENDFGTAVIDLFFDPNKPVNTFFFFERGGRANKSATHAGDSDLLVQGLDIAGNLIGTAFKIDRSQWTDAGYTIDTTEVTNGAQKVGSYGLRSDQNFSGLRLTSMIGFNGPDFKVVASKVPEPASLLGLGLVGGMAALTRRRRAGMVG
jgi:PEP-CTERM motif